MWSSKNARGPRRDSKPCRNCDGGACRHSCDEGRGGNEDAADATVIKSFVDDYFRSEMSDALRILSAWRKDNGEDFAKIWLGEFRRGSAGAITVDRARRHVKGYFSKATRLFRFGAIRKATLRAIVSVGGINVFYEIVEPLERALDSNRADVTVKTLRSVVPRFGRGDVVDDRREGA